MPVLEHEGQQRTKKRKSKTIYLSPNIVQELACKKRRKTTKGVPLQTCAPIEGDGFTPYQSKAKLYVDSKMQDISITTRARGSGGSYPLEVSVLCEPVDREPDGEEGGTHKTPWKRNFGRIRRSFAFMIDLYFRICKKLAAKPMVTLIQSET